jgi:hypothetical protein
MDSNDKQSDQLDLLWGVKAIAGYIGLNERQTHYQIELGLLPVRRQKRLIVASKSELRAHFGAANIATAATIAAPPIAASTAAQHIETTTP